MTEHNAELGSQADAPADTSRDQDEELKPSNLCERCGAFGDMDHCWVEGDCVLPHRAHSTNLVPETHVCRGCVARHREWLTEIADLWDTLDEVIEAGSIVDNTAEHQRPKKPPASPAPFRLLAWALAHPHDLWPYATGADHANDDWVNDGSLRYIGTQGLPDIPAVLGNWAQALYDARHSTAEAPRYVAAATAVLSTIDNSEIIAGLPDVDTYDAELRWIRRSLRAAHALTDPQPIGACLTTTCDGDVWAPDDAGDMPSCDRCGRRYGLRSIVRLRLHEKIRRRREGSSA